MDTHVIARLPVIAAASWLAGPIGWLNVLTVAYGSIRLLNILAFGLANFFFDHKDRTRGIASARRTALLVLINLVQVAFIFIIFDRSLAGWGLASFKTASDSIAVNDWWPFAYLSWTTLLTLGSGYQPTDGWAQLAIGTEVIVGLLMIAVTLGALIGAGRETQTSDGQ